MPRVGFLARRETNSVSIPFIRVRACRCFLKRIFVFPIDEQAFSFADSSGTESDSDGKEQLGVSWPIDLSGTLLCSQAGRCSGVPSEDSAQFEEHSLMPGRSDRSTDLNRSEYRIDHECGDDIARSL